VLLAVTKEQDEKMRSNQNGFGVKAQKPPMAGIAQQRAEA